MCLNCHDSSKQFYIAQILIKLFIHIQGKNDGEKVIDKSEMTVKSINGVATSGCSWLLMAVNIKIHQRAAV